MCVTSDLIEELQYIKEKGKSLKDEVEDAKDQVMDIRQTYALQFEKLRNLKQRISKESHHRIDKTSKLHSWCTPMATDLRTKDALNRVLHQPRQRMSNLNEYIRIGQIRLKELRSQYKDVLTQLKG